MKIANTVHVTSDWLLQFELLDNGENPNFKSKNCNIWDEKLSNQPGVYFGGDSARDDVEDLDSEQHHQLVHGRAHLLLHIPANTLTLHI